MAESDYAPSESEDEEFFEAAIANLDRIMDDSDEPAEEHKSSSSDEEYKSSHSQ